MKSSRRLSLAPDGTPERPCSGGAGSARPRAVEGRAGVAQSPDRARFIESLQPHQGRVEHWLLWRYSWAQRDDVIDALQQAYTQIWATHSIPPLQRPAAYLTTVAGNVLLTLWRRQAILRLSLEDDMDKRQSPLEGPEDAASKAELTRVVLEAVKGLSVKRRALFLAWYRDEINLGSMAREQGISVSTAENELYRAVEQVKKFVRTRLGYDPLTR
jgi:RNA polymerase sigma factor (sigma-70 family)